MPSTTRERAARWEHDGRATRFLYESGFTLTHNFCWRHPSKKLEDLTFDEEDAIIYLIEEWDYGGLLND